MKEILGQDSMKRILGSSAIRPSPCVAIMRMRGLLLDLGKARKFCDTATGDQNDA